MLKIFKSVAFWLIVGVVLFITAQFTEIEFIGYVGLGLMAITCLIYFSAGIVNFIKDLFC